MPDSSMLTSIHRAISAPLELGPTLLPWYWHGPVPCQLSNPKLTSSNKTNNNIPAIRRNNRVTKLPRPETSSVNQSQHKTVSTLPLLPLYLAELPLGDRRANSRRKGQLDSRLYGKTIRLPNMGMFVNRLSVYIYFYVLRRWLFQCFVWELDLQKVVKSRGHSLRLVMAWNYSKISSHSPKNRNSFVLIFCGSRKLIWQRKLALNRN